MKRSEFIEIIETVMEVVEHSNHDAQTYTCVLLERMGGSRIAIDYSKIFGKLNKFGDYNIPVGFLFTKKERIHDNSNYLSKPRRLNALSMYLAQSLAFGTYKDL